MKKFFLFGLFAAMLISGCKKNEKPDNPSDPNTPVPNPEGTVTANISETTNIVISGASRGTIAWIRPDNFNLNSHLGAVSICDMGAMNGLGNITDIPLLADFTDPQSYNKTVACELGHGYVVKFENRYAASQYVRLYIEESLVSVGGEVMGAKVKYQYPFESTDTLAVSSDSLSFTRVTSTQRITVTTDASEWNYYCHADWISLERIGNVLAVSVHENQGFPRDTVIAISAGWQRKNIVVEQDGATTSAPYAVGDRYYENGVLGVVYQVTDGGTNGMIVSLEETECEWSTELIVTGCTDMAYGMNNMRAIKVIQGFWENRYPAFSWCNNLHREMFRDGIFRQRMN